MLTPFVYAFRIAFAIILAVPTAIGINNEQECSYSSVTYNNTAQVWLWNCSTTSGDPSGIHLVETDRN